jgi:hypothetical protein
MDFDAVWVEPGGWLLIEEFGVRVRFVETDDGRFVPVGVESLDSPLTLRLLQQIPFGRIEAAANTSLVANELRILVEYSLEDARVKVEPADGSHREMVTIDMRGPEGKAEDKVRSVIASKPTRYGDDFYEAFSVVYEWEATQSEGPGAVLADRLNVPVGSVWRWVRVCRSKGYLAPSRVGKET